MMNIPLRVALVFLLGAILLPGSLAWPAPHKTIKVGAFQYAPAIFKNEEGKVQGVFVDLLDEVGRQEKISFEYVFGTWQQGLDRLKSGEIDLLTSVAFKEERDRYMTYGRQPLMTVWGELYAHQDADLKSLLDVQGKKVAVMKGDFNGAMFIDMMQRFGMAAEYVEVPDFESVLQTIEDGRVDAGVISVMVGASASRNYRVKPTGTIFNPFDIYFTVPEGKGIELLTLLDDYLQRWRNDEQSIYFKAHHKWFHEKLRIKRVPVLPDWLWQVLIGILLIFVVALTFIVILRRQVRRAIFNLRASEAHFRKAIEEAPIPIMMHAEGGEILALSSTWRLLSGYSAEALPTTAEWARRAYGIDHEQALADIDQLYELDAPKQEGDCVIRCADGSRRVWAFSSTAIGRLPDNRRIAISMASDVTERLQYEKKLSDSEERYHQLFEQLLGGFALLEVFCAEQGVANDLRFLMVNKGFETLTSLSAEAVVNKTARDVMPGLEDYWFKHYGKVAFTGEPEEFEAYTAELNKHFIVRAYSPEPDKVAVLFYDITEQKQAEQERKLFIEQLEAKNAELERISYTISHDLKTPLVTLKSFIEYLNQDLANADTQRIAQDIHFITAAADKMSQLLNELLEFTRLGRVEEKPVELNFSVLVADVLDHLAGDIVNRKVDVLVTGEDLPLHADAQRMKELWQNLIENAIKYMGEQPAPQVIVGFERVANEIIFFVRDNGIGIEPQYSGKIFKLFEKLDSAVEGTGIGLALVKRIVELHQGRLWMESEGLNAGSCFKFTLPQALAAAPEQTNDE